jgi:sRNA-binding protein
MASNYRLERARGTKESPQQLALLRDKWPLAFPLEQQDVRPLATGAAREIAAVMDWSLPYTLGVLKSWKMAPVYCQAVISYDQRIALDGTLAEAVDVEAKDLAAKRLAELWLWLPQRTIAPQPLWRTSQALRNPAVLTSTILQR